MCSEPRKRGFIEEAKSYVEGFFTNLDQPDMGPAEKWSKFFRNRARATVKGCCGHPGDPGC